MKKITFILLAFISANVFAQDEAKGTADVNAEIVSPIKITNGTALDFGRVIGSEAGGTVTIANNSDRTASNDELLAPSTTVQAASFDVTAANTYNYSILIPGINLTGDGDDMPVTFTNNLGDTSVGTGSVQELLVGGGLTVNANQAEGNYSGTVEVTVSYE